MFHSIRNNKKNLQDLDARSKITAVSRQDDIVFLRSLRTILHLQIAELLLIQGQRY
jgi:hypothetical protein